MIGSQFKVKYTDSRLRRNFCEHVGWGAMESGPGYSQLLPSVCGANSHIVRNSMSETDNLT